MPELTQIQDLPIDYYWLDCATNEDASIMFVVGFKDQLVLYRCKNDIWTESISVSLPSISPTAQIVCDSSGKYVIYNTSTEIYVSSDYGDTFSLSTLPSNTGTVLGVCIGGTPILQDCYYYATIFLKNTNGSSSILRSENFGQSWKTVCTKPGVVGRIAAAKKTGYVYTLNTNLSSQDKTSTFLISTNYGIDWVKQNQIVFGTSPRIFTNNDGQIVTFSVNGETIVIPYYSNTYLKQICNVKDQEGTTVSSNSPEPIFLTNSGKEFLCVKGYDETTTQIYNSKDFSSEIVVSKFSDQNMTWTCLCVSELLEPNGSKTYLAGTYKNGVWIYKSQ